MLDCKTFYSIPNWLNLEGHRLPVIVSGRYSKLSFPSLRSVHSGDGETHRLPRKECPFCRECRHSSIGML